MEDFVKYLISWNDNNLSGPKILCRTLAGNILVDCVVDNNFLLSYPNFGIDNYFQTYKVVCKDKYYSNICDALADIPLDDFTTTTEFTIIIMDSEPPVLTRSYAGQYNYRPDTMAVVFKNAHDIIQIQCNLGCFLFPKSKVPPDIMAQCLKEGNNLRILEKIYNI
jgi:hypothetical protein